MAKIMMITDSVNCWQHGIWWHRQQTPAEALSKRGHAVKQVAIGSTFSEQLLSFPDVVIFGRTYAQGLEPIKWLREFKKRGAKILYDMDDDFWEVAKDNPSTLVSNALKDQYEELIKEADAVITPSKVLAEKFKKHFKKKIFICPNGINYDIYRERPHENQKLTIGYMGAASHWKDLTLIGRVIDALSAKYDFIFTIYGLTGDALEAAMYAYQKILSNNTQPEKNEYFKAALEFATQLKNVRTLHVPFMPPELHPIVLSRVDFDIGLAPLEDTKFNNGKSCIKFYEYAAVGTVTVASDVEPYKPEVNYRAKNTFKDWYNKLEKLIIDEKFRKKILKEQMEYVSKNRNLDAIGTLWELACQKEGGIEVANQRGWRKLLGMK